MERAATTSDYKMYGPWLLVLVSLLSYGDCLPLDYMPQGGDYIQKKDVFMSRGWGAGGMPFSVLYMHPQQKQQQQQQQQQQLPPQLRAEQLTAAEDIAVPNPSPYKQIKLRTAVSSAALPSRRQYSIIPQLFVSYGWGPLGK
ncbi:uncharacterized protein [Anabrus simplex]|uniref:uncharacterized protein isoform X2 n=1 Tax=Anabrus simplex TaxID=316456 RepID=UPI0035A298C3